MATISISSDLEVLEKYNSLVRESLGSDSVYIRAKETIQDLFIDGLITSGDKAAVISNVIGGIVNSITTSSMAAAVDWAKAEKEIDLKKLELAIQLDILEQEKLLTDL